MRPVWHTRISSAVAPMSPATAVTQSFGGGSARGTGGGVRVARGQDHPGRPAPGGGEVGPTHLDRRRRGQIGGEDTGGGNGAAIGGRHDGDVVARCRP